mgnify:CR=1 FL=1
MTASGEFSQKGNRIVYKILMEISDSVCFINVFLSE